MRCADVFIGALTAEAPDASEAGRAGLMVHTPEAALHAESTEPGAYLETGETGIPIANETARRLACDAIRRTVLEDARGVPLKLGRRTRTVPLHLFRLLKHRDRHCRAPGCTRTIGLHAHHIVHWADGGTTDLDNLVLVCSRHHHLVHEEHWQHLRTPQPTRNPPSSDHRNLNPSRPTPPPLDPQLRERFLVATRSTWGATGRAHSDVAVAAQICSTVVATKPFATNRSRAASATRFVVSAMRSARLLVTPMIVRVNRRSRGRRRSDASSPCRRGGGAGS